MSERKFSRQIISIEKKMKFLKVVKKIKKISEVYYLNFVSIKNFLIIFNL